MQENPPTNGGKKNGKAATGIDLAEAAASARNLISRLADGLQFRDGPASATLRNAGDILSRLVPAEGAPESESKLDPTSMLVVDVSDLLGYFELNRLPTGIQRVQTELIFNLLESTSHHARLCCFVETRHQWVVVDSRQFLDICAQCRAGGDPLEPRWVASISELRAAISASPPMVFPRNAVLMNVGTSWWLPNYFLYVREAKVASGIRYVPLIHDLIPVLMPENCDPKQVQEFIGWFIGVLDHADFYLANSESTRNDLITFAEKLGRPILPERVAVVPLDADFRTAATQTPPKTRRFAEPFVLFVSTLEARKNQLGALDAWSALIAAHGPEKIPRLVLVGKRGFKSDLILDRLKGNADLQERVTILPSVEDAELQALYRDCLFTIYPSFYEGWGLPVTESLCYGKVPLIADNSSLPEAGGTSALYFRTGSTAAMISALERLIFESAYRRKQEDVIRCHFRPRSWAEIADGVADQIAHWAALPGTEWQPPLARPGAYYPLRRNRSRRVWPGMGSAEKFRRGFGWHELEDGGCWTLACGAELEMRVASTDSYRLGLQLICSGQSDVRYRVEAIDHDSFVEGRITAGNAKWAFLDLPREIGDAPLRIRITTTILDEPETTGTRGVGLGGFFIVENDAGSRLNFIEAAALGALSDLDFYRDRSLDALIGQPD